MAKNPFKNENDCIKNPISAILKSVFFFQCAEEAGLPHDDILNCYSSDVSVQLQLDAEQKTKQLASPRPMLSFVPTIVYNHVIYCHILNYPPITNYIFETFLGDKFQYIESDMIDTILQYGYYLYFQQYDHTKQDRSLYEFGKVLCEEIQKVSTQPPAICSRLWTVFIQKHADFH